MQVQNNLKAYNTFGINVACNELFFLNTVEEISTVFEKCKGSNTLILGGGSNVLFTKDVFHGNVIVNRIKGFEIIPNNDETSFVKAGSGEVWHEFVLKCIDHDLGGLENLSLIPGSVGASPMQNIGAYGVEIKDVFESLEAYHIETGEIHIFSKEACKFGYRESVFKRALKNQYIITSVTFKLTKQNHKLNTSYGVIEAELDQMNVSQPTIKDVSNAVIAIRSSKLPDPKKIGNAGSFFKNPVVESIVLEHIKLTHSTCPSYPATEGHVKLAAGWLIEQCGWKGKTIKDYYGVHKLQALVLVNYGGATGSEIYDLSTDIIKDVKNTFGVELEREVNMIL